MAGCLQGGEVRGVELKGRREGEREGGRRMRLGCLWIEKPG